MKKIEVTFIGDYKLGDNIAYNFKILQALYNAQAQLSNDHERCLLNKPITVILISIIEALLHDFFFRIKSHTSENSINLPKSVLDEIRTKKHNKFNHYIDAITKYGTSFDSKAKIKKFHAGLTKLQQLRNRVHIQNTRKQLEKDEVKAFTAEKKVLAEKYLEFFLGVF